MLPLMLFSIQLNNIKSFNSKNHLLCINEKTSLICIDIIWDEVFKNIKTVLKIIDTFLDDNV